MKRFSPLTRITAALSIFFFLTAEAAAAPLLRPVEVPAAGFAGVIPGDIGYVQHWLPAPQTAPQVILVQDAHGQFEAQKNIKQILEVLHAGNLLGRLYIEGGTGRLYPERLLLFRENEFNRRAAEFLVRYAEIGGPEWMLIEQAAEKEEAIPVFGAEEPGLYLQNLEQFARVNAAGRDALAALEAYESDLLSLSSRLAGGRFHDLFKNWMHYEKKQAELGSFLGELMEEARTSPGIAWENPAIQLEWPMLVRFRLLREESSAPETLEQERARLAEWCRKRGLVLPGGGPGSDEPALRRRWEDFYRAAVPFGFRFSDFPHLARSGGREIVESELDPGAFFDEAARLRDLVFDSLAENGEEKILLEKYRIYVLLKNLFSLTMTPDDLDELNARLQAGYELPEAFVPFWEEARLFYELAEKRDEVMAARLLEDASAAGPEDGAAVLVAGGFHTPGIVRRLREAGVSYAVITPRLKNLEDSGRYLHAMTAANAEEIDFDQFTLRGANWFMDWGGQLPGPIQARRREIIQRLLDRGERAGAKPALRRSELREETAGELQRYSVRVRPDQSFRIRITRDLFSARNPLLRREIEGRRFVVLVDASVPASLTESLRAYLKAREEQLIRIALPADHRSYEDMRRWVDEIHRRADEEHVSRKDIFLVLGSDPVFFDVAARAAATYHRGVPYVRIPAVPVKDVPRLFSIRAGIEKFGVPQMDGAVYPPQSVLIDERFQTKQDTAFAAGTRRMIEEEMHSRASRDEFFINEAEDGLAVTFVRSQDYEVALTPDLFNTAGNELSRRVGNRKKLFIIDASIGKGAIEELRRNLGLSSEEIFLLQGGEAVKDEVRGRKLVEEIHALAWSRDMRADDVFVLIGGGAVLDLGGFAASRYDGGTAHIRIPTTLLAQIDAGVGVKNGINKFNQKNFEGIFMPAESVLIDPFLLRALSKRQMHAGMAEMIKVSLMKDSRYFELLEENFQQLLDLDFSPGSKTYEMMWLSILRHVEQIQTDPFETKLARPLDYGHEWGHRWERVTYERYGSLGAEHVIAHGEGVWFGAAIDTVISWQRGYITSEDRDRVLDLIDAAGYHNTAVSAIPTYDPRASADDLWPGLESFRIHLGGKLTISLLDAIGVKRDVNRLSRKNLERALEFLKKRYRARSELREEEIPDSTGAADDGLKPAEEISGRRDKDPQELLRVLDKIPELHERIRLVREFSGLSPAELARKESIKVSLTQVKAYERKESGKRNVPGEDYVRALGRIAGIDPALIDHRILVSDLRDETSSETRRRRVQDFVEARLERKGQGVPEYADDNARLDFIALEAGVEAGMIDRRRLEYELSKITSLRDRLVRVRNLLAPSISVLKKKYEIRASKNMIAVYEDPRDDVRIEPSPAYVRELARAAGIDPAVLYWGKSLKDVLRDTPEMHVRLVRLREYLGDNQRTLSKRRQIKSSFGLISLYEHEEAARRLPPPFHYVEALSRLAGVSPGSVDPRYLDKKIRHSLRGERFLHVRLRKIRELLGETPETMAARPDISQDAAAIRSYESKDAEDRRLPPDSYIQELAAAAGIGPELVDLRTFRRNLLQEPELYARLIAIRELLGVTQKELSLMDGIPANEKQISGYESANPGRRRNPPSEYINALAALAGVEAAVIDKAGLKKTLRETPGPGERLRIVREALGETPESLSAQTGVPAGTEEIRAMENDADGDLPRAEYVKYLTSLAGLESVDLDRSGLEESLLKELRLHRRLKIMREFFGELITPFGHRADIPAGDRLISEYETEDAAARKDPALEYVERLAALAGIEPMLIDRRLLERRLLGVSLPHERFRFVRRFLKHTPESLVTVLPGSLKAEDIRAFENGDAAGRKKPAGRTVKALAELAGIDAAYLDRGLLEESLRQEPEISVRLRKLRSFLQETAEALEAGPDITLTASRIYQLERNGFTLWTEQVFAYVLALSRLTGIHPGVLGITPEVRARFNAGGETMDSIQAKILVPYLDEAIEAHQSGRAGAQTGKLVHARAGAGSLTESFGSRFRQVTAIEESAAAVESLESKDISGLQVLRGRLEEVPPLKEADVILVSSAERVFYDLDRSRETLDKVQRALRPNGLLLLAAGPAPDEKVAEALGLKKYRDMDAKALSMVLTNRGFEVRQKLIHVSLSSASPDRLISILSSLAGPGAVFAESRTKDAAHLLQDENGYSLELTWTLFEAAQTEDQPAGIRPLSRVREFLKVLPEPEENQFYLKLAAVMQDVDEDEDSPYASGTEALLPFVQSLPSFRRRLTDSERHELLQEISDGGMKRIHETAMWVRGLNGPSEDGGNPVEAAFFEPLFYHRAASLQELVPVSFRVRSELRDDERELRALFSKGITAVDEERLETAEQLIAEIEGKPLDETASLSLVFLKARKALVEHDMDLAAGYIAQIEAKDPDFKTLGTGATLAGLKKRLNLFLRYEGELKEKGYEFVRRLGAGTFGDAFLFRSPDPAVPLAVLKIIGGTGLDISLFEDLMSAQGQLELDYERGQNFYDAAGDDETRAIMPRNIMRFDDDSEDGLGLANAIVMDFISGRPYRKAIEAARNDAERALIRRKTPELFVHIIRTLREAGLYILDFREENFFVAVDGENVILKTIDRGLVNTLKEDSNMEFIYGSTIAGYESITGEPAGFDFVNEIRTIYGFPAFSPEEWKKLISAEALALTAGLDGPQRDLRRREALERRRQSGVTPEKVRQAERLLLQNGVLQEDAPPPLVEKAGINEFVGGLTDQSVRVLLSDQTVHPTGSFKVLAPVQLYELAELKAAPRKVIGVSTGNHGKAIADAARRVSGARAQIYMDETTLEHKREAIQALGAQVILTHEGKLIRSYREAEDIVHRLTQRHPWMDAIFDFVRTSRRIPEWLRRLLLRFLAPSVIQIPHADVHVVSGYAVAGSLIAGQLQAGGIDEFDVISPGGSYGFAAGLAQILESRPQAALSVVSAAPADLSYRSVKEGRLVREDIAPIEINVDRYMDFLGDAGLELQGMHELIVDGISATPEPFALDLVQSSADSLVLVSQLDALFATALLERYGLRVEPTSGLPLAARILYPQLYSAPAAVMPLTSRNRSEKMDEIIRMLAADETAIEGYFRKRQKEIRGTEERGLPRSELRVIAAVPDERESAAAIAREMTDGIFAVEDTFAFRTEIMGVAGRGGLSVEDLAVLDAISSEIPRLIPEGGRIVLPAWTLMQLSRRERDIFFNRVLAPAAIRSGTDGPLVYFAGRDADGLKQEFFVAAGPDLRKTVEISLQREDVTAGRLDAETVSVSLLPSDAAGTESRDFPVFLIPEEEFKKLSSAERLQYLARMVELQFLAARFIPSGLTAEEISLKTAELLRQAGIDYQSGAGGYLMPSVRSLLSESLSRYLAVHTELSASA